MARRAEPPSTGPTAPDECAAAARGILVHPEHEAAVMLGLSARTLQRLRLEGGGPPYVQLTTQRVGYTPAALRTWLEARQVSSTAAAKVARAHEPARA